MKMGEEENALRPIFGSDNRQKELSLRSKVESFILTWALSAWMVLHVMYESNIYF